MRLPLANLLVKSPLPRIQLLMDRVVATSEQVPKIIEKLVEQDHAAISRLAKDTSVLEGEADAAKNDVRDHFPSQLFLPVDRRDMLRLISEIDAIADCAEDVGVLLTLRQFEIPEDMKTVLVLFVERVMDTVATARELVATLEGLVEAGFGGRPADEAKTLVQEVSRKEHEADKLQDQCAKILFRSEGELSPTAIFMWTKLLNKLGDMANHAENVGDQFRLFIAR